MFSSAADEDWVVIVELAGGGGGRWDKSAHGAWPGGMELGGRCVISPPSRPLCRPFVIVWFWSRPTLFVWPQNHITAILGTRLADEKKILTSIGLKNCGKKGSQG